MKRSTGLMLALAMFFAAVYAPPVATAAAPEAAPLVEQTTPADGMIRVSLSSIRGKAAYNLTISGTYTLNGTTLSNGTKVKVEFSGGTVYTTVDGVRTSAGSSVTLKRVNGGVKIAEALAPANLYPGDMRFLYSSGTAYMVCYLYIEDYVYGVLPYEMDDSFPLEALKAQAVTARTYGMRAKTSSGVYDVTDTTTHQVFRGVNYGKTRCIKAVDETWGIVIKYNGSFAGAYYSASNGGQTEASNHVWGGSPINYLQIKDDPYDLANTRAVKKSYMIYATPANGSSTSAYTMIKSALASQLGGSAESYTIEAITDVMLHTPMYAAPSKLYTRLQVSVQYGGGKTATVDIPIFPTVQSALSLGINSQNNELYTVDKEATGFRVSARRYGHGAGMSQRGAEQMGETGFSYAQILGFYYTGVQRVRMNLSTNWSSASPTPAPVEDAAGVVGETPAKVQLADPNDRLNLRSDANNTSSVVGKIPSGADVTVLSTNGNWCKIRYGTLTGYVAKQYLSMQTPAAAPTSETGAAATAVVKLSSGSLNMRKENNASSATVGSIPNGATVTMVEHGETWSRVRYNNQTGYVNTKYLAITQAAATAAPQAGGLTTTVSLVNTDETLNLRLNPASSAPVLALLRHGTALAVLENGAEWTKVTAMGMTGYVMTKFIAVTATADAGTATAAPGLVPTAVPAQQTLRGTVSLSSGTLNMRSQPNGTAYVVHKLPNGATVDVTQAGDVWCAVSYAGLSGYVLRNYLRIEESVATATAATTAAPAVPAQATPVPTIAPSTTVAWVVTKDGDRVNLRRSDSSSGTVLDRLPYGTEVTVLEPGKNWTYVSYKEYTGYISTQYLSSERPAGTVAAAATPAPADASSGTKGSAWISTKDGGAVNLRKQASKSSDALALLPTGGEVTLLEVGADWCKVIYKGLTGYVMGSYLTFTAPAAPVQVAAATQAGAPAAAQQPQPQPVQPQPAATESVVVGDKRTVMNSGKVKLNSPTATLHLNTEPSELSSYTGTLKQHAEVEVLQYCGNEAQWLYVRSGSTEGYALAANISLNYDIARVSLADANGALTVRSSPSESASEIAALGHGTLLTVQEAESGWVRIKMEDGGVGYVSASYIRYL